MNKEIANILKEELRFENQSYSSFKTFKEEIISIYEKLKGKFGDKEEFSLKEKIAIKKEVKKYITELYSNLEVGLSKEIEEQFKILEEREGTSSILLLGVLFQGLSITEMILKQQSYHLDKIFKMINNNIIEKTYFYSPAILEQLFTISNTISKQGREDIRNKKTGKNIIGWKSVAVLDGKTSTTCLSKHNKFYSKETYGSRENIPDLPPRHYNCRSIIVEVYDNEGKLEGKDDLNTFFKENQDDALDILGKNRYELFKDGKIEFKSFLDVRREKLYTIEELKKRLL